MALFQLPEDNQPRSALRRQLEELLCDVADTLATSGAAPTQAAVLQRLLRQHTQAFLLWAIAYYRARRFAGLDPEDLAHELWLKFAANAESIQADDLAAYVLATAQHLGIDGWRRASRLSQICSGSNAAIFERRDQCLGPDEEAIAQETLQTVRRLLGPSAAKAMRLARDGYKTREIAKMLSRPLRTVQLDLHNARALLMEEWSGKTNPAQSGRSHRLGRGRPATVRAHHRKETPMTHAKKSFAVQMKEFFGLLPGQSISSFARELKALTEADKAELAALLSVAGYPCDLPAATDASAA
jgi:DNA-directed RNA polymerase specialized sigma24 family protein